MRLRRFKLARDLANLLNLILFSVALFPARTLADEQRQQPSNVRSNELLTPTGTGFDSSRLVVSEPSPTYPFEVRQQLIIAPSNKSAYEVEQGKTELAEKTFAMESNFRRSTPISRNRDRAKIILNDALRKHRPDLTDERRREVVQGVGRAWEEAANQNADVSGEQMAYEVAKDIYGYVPDRGLVLRILQGIDTSEGPYGAKIPGRFNKAVEALKTLEKNGTRLQREGDRDALLNTLPLTNDSSRLDPFGTAFPSADFFSDHAERAINDPILGEDLKILVPDLVSGQNFSEVSSEKLFAVTPQAKWELELLGKHLGLGNNLAEVRTALRNSSKLQNAVNGTLQDLQKSNESMRADLHYLRDREMKREAEEDREKAIAAIDAEVRGPIAAANLLSNFVKDPRLNRALKIGAATLEVGKVMKKALKGLISPMNAISTVGDIFGGVMSLFGGPSLDEQILLELRELRAFVEKMYVDMMVEFAGLREQIQDLHASIDRQFEHLENRISADLATLNRLGNETSSGLVEVVRQAHAHSDDARFRQYESDVTVLKNKTKRFRSGQTGGSGLREDEFKQLYDACRSSCENGCSLATMTGNPVQLSNAEYGSEAFFSAFAGRIAGRWDTAEVMRPFSQACSMVGSPLCDEGENLSNYLCWSLASRGLLDGANLHGNYYDSIHQETIREETSTPGEGKEVLGRTHHQLKDSLVTGRALQRASHRLAWKDGGELNRGHLRTLVTGHLSQIAQIETSLERTADSLLKDSIGIEAWRGPRLPKELLRLTVEVKNCDPHAKPELQITPTEEEREFLLSLLPRDALILGRLKTGKVTFCLETPGKDKFAALRDEPCIYETYNKGRDQSGFGYSSECTQTANPVFNLRASLRIDSDTIPILNIRLIGNSRLRVQTKRDGRGGKSTEEHQEWDGSFSSAWNTGEVNKLLSMRPDATKDVVSSGLQRITSDVEKTVEESRKKFLTQIGLDYGLGAPTISVQKPIDALDTNKQIIARSLGFGFEPLNSTLVASLEALPDGSQVTKQILDHREDLTNPTKRTALFDSLRRQTGALLPAFETGLKDLEMQSIEKFVAGYPGADKEVLASLYAKNYPKNSKVAKLGRFAPIEGTVERLESAIMARDRDAVATIEHERNLRTNELSPRSVWAEPQALPIEIKLCNGFTDRAGVGTLRLSDRESATFKRSLLEASRPEDWIAFSIGATQLSVCWKPHSNQNKRFVELVAAYGIDMEDATPTSRHPEESLTSVGSTGKLNYLMRVARTRKNPALLARLTPLPNPVPHGDSMPRSAPENARIDVQPAQEAVAPVAFERVLQTNMLILEVALRPSVSRQPFKGRDL